MTDASGRYGSGSEVDAPDGDGSPGRATGAWLAPRRTVLPVFYGLASAWLVPLHVLGGRNVLGGNCRTVATCLDHALVLVPATLLVGLPVTYVVAAALTGLVERRTGLVDAAPWAFAPPDDVHRLLVALGGLSLATLFAGGYGAVVTPVGVALVYVLHYPLFAVAMASAAVPEGADSPAGWLVVVAAFATMTAGEVGWLYLLAYGVRRARTLAATAWGRLPVG